MNILVSLSIYDMLYMNIIDLKSWIFFLSHSFYSYDIISYFYDIISDARATMYDAHVDQHVDVVKT